MSNAFNPKAFPLSVGENDHCAHGGMTLRDYFAAAALPGVIQAGIDGTVKDAAETLGIKPEEYNYKIHYPQIAAIEAYQLADAMLAHRAKEQPK